MPGALPAPRAVSVPPWWIENVTFDVASHVMPGCEGEVGTTVNSVVEPAIRETVLRVIRKGLVLVDMTPRRTIETSEF
jgi:hypothetical protein